MAPRRDRPRTKTRPSESLARGAPVEQTALQPATFLRSRQRKSAKAPVQIRRYQAFAAPPPPHRFRPGQSVPRFNCMCICGVPSFARRVRVPKAPKVAALLYQGLIFKRTTIRVLCGRCRQKMGV